MKTEIGWLTRDKRKFRKAQQLLSPCILERGGLWADLGCGEGIFTAVLYEQMGQEGEIYAVDKNRKALSTLEDNFREIYPEASIHLLHADFKEPLSIPPLDGILMANALHFVEDDQKAPVLEGLSKKLKSTGKIIIIEYNTSRSNYAVPFPLDEDRFLELAAQVHLQNPRIVAKVPSSFLGEMYTGIALSS
jgi:ubiquinone/menaquinone biosynthesis C-methylase UbiE